MVDTTNLLSELLDMGHSMEWSKKKVELMNIDNAIERLGAQIDVLISSRKPYSIISVELDRLTEEQNELQDRRESCSLELIAIEATEED